VLTTPSRLGSGLATIAAHAITTALQQAGPFSHEDHSRLSKQLIADLRGHTGVKAVYMMFEGLSGGDRKRTYTIRVSDHRLTERVLSFGALATGTTITSQVPGATFGSPESIGFPGLPPAHVCAAAPTAQHAGPALAPTCAGGPSGYVTAGTMARLTTPANTVSIRVGTSQAGPGGFSAELDGFDANGRLVHQDAALVGSSTSGQSAGLAKTLQISAGHAESIVYLAIFLNAYWTPGPDLILDDLAYTGI
jgi:hypothetical protein